MKLSKLLAFFSFFTIQAFAQQVPLPKRGDFVFPVRPNQENYLAGTMGELRTTHFHAGIDIKTSQTTGLPIYATANGYIQRIKISTGGYGNALYMFHPHNNTVSVYGHLKSFAPQIADYVRKKQYEKKSYSVNLFPSKDEFLFQQGEEIAKSGNSGSSSGPHLHFEIRDKEHKILNPLDYGFNEIVDNSPPVIKKVAFVTMDVHSRVNGLYGRFEFDVLQDDQGFPMLSDEVSLFGQIGVEVYAYDRFDGARNKNGVPFQVLTLDGEQVFEQNISSMEFNMQRYILIHTNYKASSQGSRRFNKLYVDKGNTLTFYTTLENNGRIVINDMESHLMTIRLEDVYGNINQYEFPLNHSEDELKDYQQLMSRKKKEYELFGHILELKSNLSNHAYCEAKIHIDSSVYVAQMAYDVLHDGYYLWDMRLGLPDSVVICEQTILIDYDQMIPSGQKVSYLADHMKATFGRETLFDTAYFKYSYDFREDGNMEVFDFQSPEVPFRKYAYITLSPQLEYNREKTSVYSINKKGRLNYAGGDWINHEIKFKTRSWVPYTLATDTLSPKITELKSPNGKLRFRISDEMSGIEEVRAELNGEWLLMNYDPKRSLIWSDEKVQVSGELILSVKDHVENESRFVKTYE